MSSNLILLAIMTIALLGKAHTVAAAAAILIVLKLSGLGHYLYPVIEKNGITFGITMLIAAILMPIAKETVTAASIKGIFMSWIGIAALILSFATTYLSGRGLEFLTEQGYSSIMPSMILGAVIAAAFLGGVPVGPFITSGLLVMLIGLFELIKRYF